MPRCFGAGAFSELLYRLGFISDGMDEAIQVFPTIPRPYFIRVWTTLKETLQERFPLDLEALRQGTFEGVFDLPAAVYLTIGMIKAVRILHDVGFVLIGIAPSAFSLRLPPSGLLFRDESELADMVRLHGQERIKSGGRLGLLLRPSPHGRLRHGLREEARRLSSIHFGGGVPG